MRYFLLLVTGSVIFTFSIRAQYVNIPDSNFRSFLIQQFPSCFNASQLLDTTCSEVVNATGLHPTGTVSNWEGFKYFKNLQTVDFSYCNGFSYLPGLPITLKKLLCKNETGITTLPDLPDGLLYLDCSWLYNLTSLPALPASLVYLNCALDDELQSLPTLPNSLVYLNCRHINLQSMPALPASLTFLDCSSNSLLTSLPPLPASLDTLECSGNSLTSLPALPGSLTHLNFYDNDVTVLPSLPAQLKWLNCRSNALLTLPALPAELKYLEASNNEITLLPALPAALKELYVGGNNLSSLPALPSLLQNLNINVNQITTLPPLPGSVTDLGLGHNLLTSLPPLPPGLRTLACYFNQITVLPDFPASLYIIDCSENLLTSLPSLPNRLNYLNCKSNRLYCLPVLPDSAEISLDIHMDNRVNCIPNARNGIIVTAYDTLSGNQLFSGAALNYPLCSAVNNCNHCNAFPLMTGYVYYDNNNNLIRDLNEPARAHVKVQLSDGTFTFTDNDGYYQIAADSIGTYSITVVIPNFITSVPLQYIFNFITYDTLVKNDFALQATAVVDSVNISVIPVNAVTRPGAAYPYAIIYENVGTNILSSNIVFNYDNTRLTYESCSNPAVINTGNSLTLSEPGLVSGQQNSFIGYFRINTSAVSGDSLRAYAEISANTVADRDSCVVVITGSYDPNDKSATPVLSPAQVSNGDYIYYTIRFQNTGTDTAFSIVVTDTLNSQLQASTLEMINTSHPCITTVKGSTVSFEFINIILPDSNVNELKSHGFISFRVKPQSNLALYSTVPNKASIYFDYNSPVITNSAVTIITEPIVVPLKLLSFVVNKAGHATADIHWHTSNEINVNQYNIEISTNGRNFTKAAIENAKGNQDNFYTKKVAIPKNDIIYFRLKMIDIDANYTYSQIAILKIDKVNHAFSFLKNPVADVLTITLQDPALKNTAAGIYNAEAVVVKMILLQNDVENINTKSLPAGLYYFITEKGARQFIILK